MLEKYLKFPTQDANSVNAEVIDVAHRGGGGGLDKLAGYRPPAIVKFLATLKPDPKYQYVLMTPMGASEVWGFNANGDFWPEASLAFDRVGDAQNAQQVIQGLVKRFLTPFGKTLPEGDYTRFGHRSFEDADRFMNHVNKDPSLSYGRIPVAAWNPELSRVEVIVRHDREAAKRVGAEQVIIDIDERRPRLISMGARLKFDVCSICGNLASSPKLYCQHLQYSMGGTMADGRMVYAVNVFPNFFDLSDVGVPAAKESAILAKVASQRGTSVPEVSTRVALKRVHPTSEKTADMVKRLLGGSTDLPARLGRSEPVLNAQAMKMPLSDLVPATAALGMVLKPEEFQHSWLSGRGYRVLAEALRAAARVFDPEGLDIDDMDEDLLSISLNAANPERLMELLPDVPRRSGLSPFIEPRMMAIHIVKAAAEAAPNPLPEGVHEMFFEDLNRDYNRYRAVLSANAGNIIKQAMESHPQIYASLAPADDHLFKMAQGPRGTTSFTAGYISCVYGGAPEADLRPILHTGFCS